MRFLNFYKNWRLKRHVKKFGSKNNGYFNYFNQEWFEEHQKILIWLLNHWLLKYWFRWILRIHKDCKFSEYIDEIKPHTYRIKVGGNTYKSDFRTDNKFSKRIYYAFRPYWYFLHSLDFVVQRTFNPEFSLGFDTLTCYPSGVNNTSPIDGYIYTQYFNFALGDGSTGTTWANLHDNTGSQSYDGTHYLFTDHGTNYINCEYDRAPDNNYSILHRGLTNFNTAALTSSATITSAYIGGYPAQANNGGDDPIYCGVGFTPTNTNQITDLDFNNFGTTTFFEASWAGLNTPVSDNYNGWTLNSSGLANISKTGVSSFGFRFKKDIDNSAPTISAGNQSYYNLYSSFNTGTSKDPKIVITYTVPPVTPTVTTQAVSSIASTTATGNGNVTSDGGATITERGVCWNTSTGPTTANSKATASGTTGAYTASMTSLTAGTLYYVKAYAINSIGTSYGSEVTFTASATTPTLSLPADTASNQTTTLTFSWNASSGATSYILQVSTLSTFASYFYNTNVGNNTSQSVASMIAGIIYYWRVYAVNGGGNSPASSVYSFQTADDGSTKLLLHMDGADASTTFTDSATPSKTITVAGNAQIDTAQYKFATASGLFDGTGDYIYAADSADWNFGTGDFTVDFWVRFNQLNSVNYLFSQRVDSNNAIDFHSEVTGGTNYLYQFSIVSGGSVIISFYDSGAADVINTWYHFAVVRNGTSWKIYKNGTSISSQTATQTSPDLAASFVIGARGDDFASPLNGWIDEFRVSKGIARWTDTFTPPIYAYVLPVTGPANVKTINGLAKASIKTINGVAIGSIKSINGLQ